MQDTEILQDSNSLEVWMVLVLMEGEALRYGLKKPSGMLIIF